MNWKYYHSTISDGEGSFYHIDDWCAQWSVSLRSFAMTDLTDHDDPYCSTLETGTAFCYMFDAAEKPAFPDEWYDKNKAENEKRIKNKGVLLNHEAQKQAQLRASRSNVSFMVDYDKGCYKCFQTLNFKL